MRIATWNVNSIKQRMPRLVPWLDERRPDVVCLQETKLADDALSDLLGDERCRTLVTAYIEAIEHADVDGVVALLTEDAAWSMPPTSNWLDGLDEIAAWLTRSPFKLRWRHLPTRANGQLAVGCYIWDAERGDFEAGVIDVLTLRGGRIAEVTAFVGGERFARFGLPERLPA